MWALPIFEIVSSPFSLVWPVCLSRFSDVESEIMISIRQTHFIERLLRIKNVHEKEGTNFAHIHYALAYLTQP